MLHYPVNSNSSTVIHFFVMAGLLSLPVELLQEIIVVRLPITILAHAWHRHMPLQLGNDKKNARATCRYMNFAIEPILFGNLVFDTTVATGNRPEVSMLQLEALATRQTRAVEFVKRLEIRALHIWKHPQFESLAEATENMKDFLQAAISAMKNLQSVW